MSDAAILAAVRALRQEMFENLESETHEVLLEVVIDRLDWALTPQPQEPASMADRIARYRQATANPVYNISTGRKA